MAAIDLKNANDAKTGPAVVFLPGIVAPAEARYAALVRELGEGIRAFTKDLEVYEGEPSRSDYSIEAEVAGLIAATDAAQVDQFFLYGHSAGGAISLAFAAIHSDRLLGLALDEPASDFSDETKAVWAETFAPIEALPPDERVPAFLRAQVAPGVELPPPPSGNQPEWMASRPGGIEAFKAALEKHVLPSPGSSFEGPVYYSYGSLTNPIWREIRGRLVARFPNFTADEYDGLHHLNTSHAAQPSRVAAALRRVWQI